jgi:hypothetical protein
MRRYLFALTIVAAAACFDVSSPLPPTLILSPILDSMFVGDSLGPLDFAYYNSDGQRANPGPLTWTIGPPAVATINPTTGVIHGVGKGVATVTAVAGQATGIALVAVSRPLDLTLLMDTVVLMPGDTFSLGAFLAITQKVPGPTTLTFDASPDPTLYTIDANGLIQAQNKSAAARYVAHVSDGTTTVADTGAVNVLILTDTTERGHFFESVIGTAIRHAGGPAIGVNYPRLNGRLTFQLVDSAYSADSSLLDQLLVTLTDSLIRGDTTFDIDSLGLQESSRSQLGTLDPVCNPRRPWALWRSAHRVAPPFQILALAHGTPPDSLAGHITIQQFAPAPGGGGGAVFSGRYQFIAQRTDLYNDPLGAEVIRGTFVAPLRTRQGVCAG